MTEACRLPDRFDVATEDERAAALLACANAAGSALRECEARRAALEDWIAAEN